MYMYTIASSAWRTNCHMSWPARHLMNRLCQLLFWSCEFSSFFFTLIVKHLERSLEKYIRPRPTRKKAVISRHILDIYRRLRIKLSSRGSHRYSEIGQTNYIVPGNSSLKYVPSPGALQTYPVCIGNSSTCLQAGRGLAMTLKCFGH